MDKNDEPRESSRIEVMPKVHFTRRELLRCGLYGSAALLLAGRSSLIAEGALDPQALLPAVPRPGKARSVIQIWMWGGPSHLDTFDPKPDAGRDYCGPLDKPITTKVDGMRISQLLPELAKQADKFSLIRSMTHGVNSHETASYIVQTGWKPGGRVVHPSFGAIVSRFLGRDAGYKGLIPPYIVLTRPQGRFSEAGFLGNAYKPFATGGDPARQPFLVEGIAAPGVSRQRQETRRKLLERLNTFARGQKGDPEFARFFECEEQAYDLILGDAGKVFDLSTEKKEIRDSYGRNTFGQSCLMARRLVEKGVPYITINYRGWDTHKRHFESMQRMLPQMDQGMATLLEDLSQRGLLDSTIIWWGGEFGRTPKVQWEAPWNGGRSHFGPAFSTLVAGGGFKGGHVLGSTDDKGMSIDERPVYPWDLHASMYGLLGIDPDASLRHPQGQMVPLLPNKIAGYESDGPVKELV